MPGFRGRLKVIERAVSSFVDEKQCTELMIKWFTKNEWDPRLGSFNIETLLMTLAQAKQRMKTLGLSYHKDYLARISERMEDKRDDKTCTAT